MASNVNYGAIPQEDPDFPVNMSRKTNSPAKVSNMKPQRIIAFIVGFIVLLILLAIFQIPIFLIFFI